MAVLVLFLACPFAAAQTPLVSTDELAHFDEDFIRYPVLTPRSTSASWSS